MGHPEVEEASPAEVDSPEEEDPEDIIRGEAAVTIQEDLALLGDHLDHLRTQTIRTVSGMDHDMSMAPDYRDRHGLGMACPFTR